MRTLLFTPYRLGREASGRDCRSIAPRHRAAGSAHAVRRARQRPLCPMSAPLILLLLAAPMRAGAVGRRTDGDSHAGATSSAPSTVAPK